MSREQEIPIREQNAAFVRSRIAFYEPSVSELGVRAGVLLALWCKGWHHVPDPKGVEWANPNAIAIHLRGSLSSVDNNDLTTLVFLAHDEALRVEIQPPETPDPEEVLHGEAAPVAGLRLLITARQRGGEFYEDCPTIEKALSAHRERFPESGVAA